MSAIPRRPALLVFLLALVLRVGWVATLDETLTWDDEREFATVATGLAHGEGYVSNSFRANPVLPAYLAASFRLFGERYRPARLGQAVLGAATCVLVLALGTWLVGPLVGVVSGTLVALYPPHVYLAGVFYVDVVLTFLLTLALVLAARTAGATRLAAGLALATGVALGLAVLTRSLYVVCVPAVLAAWLCTGPATVRVRLGRGVLALAGVALVVLPWTARNHAVYGRFILVSSGLYTKLWQGNTVLADGGPYDRELMWGTPQWEARLARLDPETRRAVEMRYAAVARAVEERTAALGDAMLASDEVLKVEARREILAAPGRTVVLMGKKVVTLFSAFTDTISSNAYTGSAARRLAALSFYPVLVLALCGAWLGRAHWPRLALLYLPVGSVVLAYAVLNACTRFRLPLDPYLIVFASLALVHAIRWLTTRIDVPFARRMDAARGMRGA